MTPEAPVRHVAHVRPWPDPDPCRNGIPLEDGWDQGALWSFYCQAGFDQAQASKNRMWARSRYGGYYLNKSAKGTRDVIAGCSQKYRLERGGPKENRLYLFLVVDLSSFRADAINFLDLAADGLKAGLNLDDRWYCVGFLGWRVAPGRPVLHVAALQYAEDHFDAFVCRSCGKVLPLKDLAGTRRDVGPSSLCHFCKGVKGRKS
jgi:hypothetical protein